MPNPRPLERVLLGGWPQEGGWMDMYGLIAPIPWAGKGELKACVPWHGWILNWSNEASLYIKVILYIMWEKKARQESYTQWLACYKDRYTLQKHCIWNPDTFVCVCVWKNIYTWYLLTWLKGRGKWASESARFHRKKVARKGEGERKFNIKHDSRWVGG